MIATYVGWREKSRIIFEVVDTLKNFEEEQINSQDDSEDSEACVKKEQALYIIGHSPLLEKLNHMEKYEDIRNIIQWINEEIQNSCNEGRGWDADVWESINQILGHHI